MLKFKNVTVAAGKKLIIENASFDISQNQLTAIIGLNGAGKTTLIRCVTQEQKYSGEILLNDQDISFLSNRSVAKKVAVLPQRLPCLDISVKELVSFGRNPHLGINKRPGQQDLIIINRALKQTNLESLQARPLSTLSGGEQQRAYLAMVLAQQTDLLMLDEPTSHLDVAAESAFLSQLKTLTYAGKTIAVVMHNLSMAVKYADRIIILDNKKIVFSGSKDDCLACEMIEKHFHVKRVCGINSDELFFVGVE